MATKNVMITVDEAHRGKFAAVVQACVAAGLKLGEKMPGLGALTGAIEDKKLADLRNVAGVEAVEESRDVRAIKS
jgi:hypothetical protein